MKPEETTVPTTPAAVAASDEQKSYLAMMTLAFFAGVTGLARAYRGDQQGWIRFYIWLGAIVVNFTFITQLSVTAGVAMLVLAIWGIVDFFLLHGTKTDSDEKPLRIAPIDKTFAKVMFILQIIGLALGAIGIILTLIFGGAMLNNLPKGGWNTGGTTTTTTPTEIDVTPTNEDDKEKAAAYKKAAEEIKVGDTKATVDAKLAGMTASNTYSYTSSYDGTRTDSYTYKYEYTQTKGSGSYTYDMNSSVTVSIDYENDVVKSKSVYDY